MGIEITSKEFGVTKNGELVKCYTLSTPKLRAEILDYGATIQSLFVKNKVGEWTDVVLGYDTLGEYEDNDGYLGACIGRVCNRIGKASFELNGKIYNLHKNDGENHLHGGLRGFDKKIWKASPTEEGLCFSLTSPDGEEGYPGNLEVSVTYSICEGTLTLEYNAKTDADTLCSLTNHSYFNLNGKGTILNHTLSFSAARFLENNESCLPTGNILDVSGTPLDFRNEKKIGKAIEEDHIQLKNCGGIDHNYCVARDDRALLYSPENGISMEVSTSLPGIQIYSGNFLTERKGKSSVVYKERDGICFEAQYYPNAMACEGFEKPILRPGELYHHITKYSFSVK